MNRTKQLEKLMDMLSFRRPASTKTERRFIAKFIDSVAGMQRDGFGNRFLAVGAHPSTLFSCHTDSVHEQGGMQELNLSGGIISLPNKVTKFKPSKRPKGAKVKSSLIRECLGADDGAGVFTLLSLIDAQIPGLYVFHRAEEIGGLGSEYIADYRSGWLRGINRAIAIDRKGRGDVITHQMMGRCCSDEFAMTLAIELGGEYEPCPFGTFTDTANYTRLIRECTNISAGYFMEHTWREYLDTEHLFSLVDRMCSIDFEALPTERETWEMEDYRDSLKKATEPTYKTLDCTYCQDGWVDNSCPWHGVASKYEAMETDWCSKHSMRDCWECEAEEYEAFQQGVDFKSTLMTTR